MKTDILTTEVSGNIAVVTLRSPKKMYFDMAMVDVIRGAFWSAEEPDFKSLQTENQADKSIQQKRKDLVLKAFDTLFNKRDYATAETFWPAKYELSFGHLQDQRRIDVDRIDQNNEWKGAAQNDRADN